MNWGCEVVQTTLQEQTHFLIITLRKTLQTLLVSLFEISFSYSRTQILTRYTIKTNP